MVLKVVLCAVVLLSVVIGQDLSSEDAAIEEINEDPIGRYFAQRSRGGGLKKPDSSEESKEIKSKINPIQKKPDSSEEDKGIIKDNKGQNNKEKQDSSEEVKSSKKKPDRPPDSSEEIEKGGRSTKKPSGDSSKDGKSTKKPSGDSSKDGKSTKKPSGDSSKDGKSTEKPSADSSKDGKNTKKPSGDSSKDGKSTKKPNDNSSKDGKSTEKPSGDSSKDGKGNSKENKKNPSDKSRDSSEEDKKDSKEKGDKKKPGDKSRDSSEEDKDSKEKENKKKPGDNDSSEEGSKEDGKKKKPGDRDSSEESKEDKKKPGDNRPKPSGTNETDGNCTYCKGLSTLYNNGGCKVLCRGQTTHCPTKYTCKTYIERYRAFKDKCYYNETYYPLGRTLRGVYPHINNSTECTYVCRYDNRYNITRFVTENCKYKPLTALSTQSCRDVIQLNMPLILEAKLGVSYDSKTCKITSVPAVDPARLPESNCVSRSTSGRCCYMYDKKYSRNTILPPKVANCTCNCPPILECSAPLFLSGLGG